MLYFYFYFFLFTSSHHFKKDKTLNIQFFYSISITGYEVMLTVDTGQMEVPIPSTPQATKIQAQGEEANRFSSPWADTIRESPWTDTYVQSVNHPGFSPRRYSINGNIHPKQPKEKKQIASFLLGLICTYNQ
jgi:hypothetical protein